MLKMASSPDSVEERRRLQGRVRTQRYRDHQNKDTRAQRRQSHHDRRRAVHQRATEAQWHLQEPPEERSVCITVRFNSSTSSKGRFTIVTTLYQLRFQTTLTTLTGLHLAHTFVLQSAWSTLHVSLREASLRIRMSSTDRSLIPTRIPCPASIYTVHRKRSSNGCCILGCLHYRWTYTSKMDPVMCCSYV